MDVDVIIDKVTDCLEVTSTGELVSTHFKEVVTRFKRVDNKGWKFDWAKTQDNGYTVFELFVDGEAEVQGRISMRIDGGVADVDIVEVAPHNYGHAGKYYGVGAHLFAIACNYSYNNNCDGVVAFTAKSDLIEHYQKTLGAQIAIGRRMYIDERAAYELMNKYIREE